MIKTLALMIIEAPVWSNAMGWQGCIEHCRSFWLRPRDALVERALQKGSGSFKEALLEMLIFTFIFVIAGDVNFYFHLSLLVLLTFASTLSLLVLLTLLLLCFHFCLLQSLLLVIVR